MYRWSLTAALLMTIALVFTGCGEDAAAPPPQGGTQGGVFGGEISGDFDIVLETAVGRDYPLQGPFVIRGRLSDQGARYAE